VPCIRSAGDGNGPSRYWFPRRRRWGWAAVCHGCRSRGPGQETDPPSVRVRAWNNVPAPRLLVVAARPELIIQPSSSSLAFSRQPREHFPGLRFCGAAPPTRGEGKMAWARSAQTDGLGGAASQHSDGRTNEGGSLVVAVVAIAAAGLHVSCRPPDWVRLAHLPPPPQLRAGFPGLGTRPMPDAAELCGDFGETHRPPRSLSNGRRLGWKGTISRATAATTTDDNDLSRNFAVVEVVAGRECMSGPVLGSMILKSMAGGFRFRGFPRFDSGAGARCACAPSPACLFVRSFAARSPFSRMAEIAGHGSPPAVGPPPITSPDRFPRRKWARTTACARDMDDRARWWWWWWWWCFPVPSASCTCAACSNQSATVRKQQEPPSLGGRVPDSRCRELRPTAPAVSGRSCGGGGGAPPPPPAQLRTEDGDMYGVHPLPPCPSRCRTYHIHELDAGAGAREEEGHTPARGCALRAVFLVLPFGSRSCWLEARRGSRWTPLIRCPSLWWWWWLSPTAAPKIGSSPPWVDASPCIHGTLCAVFSKRIYATSRVQRTSISTPRRCVGVGLAWWVGWGADCLPACLTDGRMNLAMQDRQGPMILAAAAAVGCSPHRAAECVLVLPPSPPPR
jgi:hypothetical protein